MIKKLLFVLLAAVFAFGNTVPAFGEDELEDVPQGETESINLAYLKPVTASSQRDNFVFICNAVNDGNLIQRWEPGVLPCWITIDLEDSYYFNEICIYPFGSAEKYTISGSADGEKWDKITDEVQAGVIASADYAFSIPVSGTYRFVRLEVTESDIADDFGVYEMEVRAPAVQTEPAEPSEVLPGVGDEGPQLLYALYPRDTAENQQIIRHLAKLGIMSGYDDETFRGDRKVSRGEFIKNVMKLLNQPPVSTSDVLFEDVPQNHACFQYINAAAERGIISGDGGSFRPDDTIIVSEAIKVITEALGYGTLAGYNGGYPMGHFIVAKQQKLLRNFPSEGEVTRFDLANLLYNAMNARFSVITGVYGEDAAFENKQTVLESCFEVHKEIGVVYADEYSSMDGKTRSGKAVKINDTEYRISGDFPELFIGNRVEFYHKDGNILSAERYSDTVMTEIDGEDIEKLSDSGVSFQREGKNKASKISFSKGVTIIYNGSVLSSYNAESLKPEYGRIRCLDWENDGRTDVLYIDDAINMKVGVVSENSIVDANLTDFRLTPIGDERYTIFQDGKKVGMPQVGNVLTIFADKYTVKDGVRIPDTQQMNICRIEVTQARADGKIVSVNTGNKEVDVGGKIYQYVSGLEEKLKLGANMELYLDYFGRICYVGEETAASETYVYCIGISPSAEFQAAKMKIFNREKVEVVELTDKAKINGYAAKGSLIALQNSGLIDAGGKSVPQLIRIRKNAEGKVSAVTTAVPGTDFELDFDSKDKTTMFFKPAGGGYSFFPVLLDSDAEIFQVPKDAGGAQDKDYKLRGVKDLTHRKNYYVRIYNLSDTRTSNLAVIYVPDGEQMSTIASWPVSVISSVEMALNEENEIEEKISYYQNGTLFSRFIANDAVREKMALYAPGDVLLLAVDDDEKIAGVTEVFSPRKGKIVNANHDNANSYLLPAFGKVVKAENNNFVLDRSEGLPDGNTTSERFLSYYAAGSVCLIYDCKRGEVMSGSVADMLAMAPDDALFVRGHMTAPKEMVLYKDYYSVEGLK